MYNTLPLLKGHAVSSPMHALKDEEGEEGGKKKKNKKIWARQDNKTETLPVMQCP